MEVLILRVYGEIQYSSIRTSRLFPDADLEGGPRGLPPPLNFGFPCVDFMDVIMGDIPVYSNITEHSFHFFL